MARTIHHEYTRVTIAVLCVLIGCTSAPAQMGPPISDHKKIIGFACNTVEPAYLKDHIAEIEQLPIDGLNIFVYPNDWGPRRNGQEGMFFGGRRFTRADFSIALADLKATPFKRFTDNFIQVEVAAAGSAVTGRPEDGNLDWFDPNWSGIAETLGSQGTGTRAEVRRLHNRVGGSMSMKIEDLIEEYRANGFVVARGLFGADLLREVTAEVERVVQDAAATAEHGRMFFDDEAEAVAGRTASAVRCVFRIQEHSNYLRELLHSALMLDLVRPLLGDEPIADGIQYIDKPPRASYEFPYHQDNAYQFYDPPRALAATVALDEQRADSGPIACLRGSHTLDILPHQPSGVLGASRGLVDPPDTATYPEVTAEVAAGDVLVHHTNVIHRTGPNRTPGHRRNLGFIYHGAGAAKDAALEREFARQCGNQHQAGAGGITRGGGNS